MASLLRAVESLHREVDDAVARLERLHGARLRCERGCSACCVDELTVFEVEAAPIRVRHAQLLASGRPHPAGGCAFLDEDGLCRVYEHRPYVCRTQGLPLRWLEPRDDGESLEYRDICSLNEAGVALTELEPSDCWTIGPTETRLQSLQQRWGGGGGRRVALRSLFTGWKTERD